MITNNQNFSAAEINKILIEIKATPNITAYSEQELKDSLAQEFVFSARNELNGQLQGLTFAKKISGTKYYSLSFLLVFPEYQKQGLGRKLYSHIVSEMGKQSIYTSSRNPIVQKWLSEDGFHSVPFLKLPFSVLLYLLKTKLTFTKLKEIRKWFLPGWKHFLR